MTISRDHTSPCRPAFSLIELLVVISIIAILLALSVAALTGMYSQASKNQTEVVLNQLQGVLTEYSTQTGSNPAENSSTFSIEDFVDAVYSDCQPAVKMLETVDSKLVVMDGNNIDTINDPWGIELRYTTGGDVNAGLPLRRAPYFASAGPDGEWGTIDSDNEPNSDGADDNIYSFDLDQ